MSRRQICLGLKTGERQKKQRGVARGAKERVLSLSRAALPPYFFTPTVFCAAPQLNERGKQAILMLSHWTRHFTLTAAFLQPGVCFNTCQLFGQLTKILKEEEGGVLQLTSFPSRETSYTSSPSLQQNAELSAGSDCRLDSKKHIFWSMQNASVPTG